MSYDLTSSLMIDIDKLRAMKSSTTAPRSTTEDRRPTTEVTVGKYTINNSDPDTLTIKSGDTIIAEHTESTGWSFNGKSMNEMWSALTNHYEAIKVILEAQK
jgi:plastocyanin